MNKLSIALSAFLLICSSFFLSGNSIARTRDCCKSRYGRERLETLDMTSLGLEYMRLKRAHCAACKSSMSDYYSIMIRLGKGLNGKSKRQITKIMGPPDSMEAGKHIYYWRGGHDYLYFTFTPGKERSQWYHAYE